MSQKDVQQAYPAFVVAAEPSAAQRNDSKAFLSLQMANYEMLGCRFAAHMDGPLLTTSASGLTYINLFYSGEKTEVCAQAIKDDIARMFGRGRIDTGYGLQGVQNGRYFRQSSVTESWEGPKLSLSVTEEISREGGASFDRLSVSIARPGEYIE